MENEFLLQHSCFFFYLIKVLERKMLILLKTIVDTDTSELIWSLEQKESDKRAGHEIIKIRCDASEH